MLDLSSSPLAEDPGGGGGERTLKQGGGVLNCKYAVASELQSYEL